MMIAVSYEPFILSGIFSSRLFHSEDNWANYFLVIMI